MYNDLKSIEKYIKEGDTSVNLRYMEMWQSIVAECSFLNEQEIEYIYAYMMWHIITIILIERKKRET